MGIEHAQEARFAGFVERLCKLLGAFRGLYRFAEVHGTILSPPHARGEESPPFLSATIPCRHTPVCDP